MSQIKTLLVGHEQEMTGRSPELDREIEEMWAAFAARDWEALVRGGFIPRALIP